MAKKRKKKQPAGELDPGIVLLLGRVHPMRLPQLLEQCQDILASITGNPQEHMAGVALRTVHAWKDLALLDWQQMEESLAKLGGLSAEACQCAVRSMQLICEHALIHYWLYHAYSSTTLQLCRYKQFFAVSSPPAELSLAYQELHQACHLADQALQTGRAISAQFRSSLVLLAEQLHAGVLSKDWGECLQRLLERMRACYEEYEKMLAKASETQGCIHWYLTHSQEESVKKETGERVGHAA